MKRCWLANPDSAVVSPGDGDNLVVHRAGRILRFKLKKKNSYNISLEARGSATALNESGDSATALNESGSSGAAALNGKPVAADWTPISWTVVGGAAAAYFEVDASGACKIRNIRREKAVVAPAPELSLKNNIRRMFPRLRDIPPAAPAAAPAPLAFEPPHTVAKSVGEVYTENIDAVCNIVMRSAQGQLMSGTGFFISANGYIATAGHVVVGTDGRRAAEVFVNIYPENTVVRATIVGVDRICDVALLKVPLTARKYFRWRNSRDVAIGERAIAIGQPLGHFVQSITAGVVQDNKCQDYCWMPESILVDYNIVGGNSGGPVIDQFGNVIGLVSWGYTIKDQAYNINGAVASYMAMRIIAKIAELSGDFPTSYLGVDFEPIGMIHCIQYPAIGRVEGVMVTGVHSGSPAQACGLVPGEVITHVDGVLVGKSNNQVPIGSILHFAGVATISLTVKRLNGQVRQVNATLIRIPAEKDIIFSGTQSVASEKCSGSTVCRRGPNFSQRWSDSECQQKKIVKTVNGILKSIETIGALGSGATHPQIKALDTHIKSNTDIGITTCPPTCGLH